MELTPEMIAIGTELATIAGKRSVETIFDKIRSVKEKGNKEEVIRNLEEIINELIDDKNRLIQISQAYEENLLAQKITNNEIDYITKSIFPLLEDFLAKNNNEGSDKIQEGLDAIKPILSKEIFNILQILGFNFKKAVGEPLTELIASLIRTNVNNVDKNLELRIINQQRELEFFKICQDEAAYTRVMNLQQK